MGREIKRVPVDFDWPIEQIWVGYVNPYTSVKCRTCNGYGTSKEFQKILDDWFRIETQYKLTQDEADLLIENKRLKNFMQVWDDDEQTYKQRLNEDGSVYHPTAAEINEVSRYGLGHGSGNQWIVCRYRAEKQGIDLKCPVCGEEGELWQSEEIKKAHDEWYPIPVPEGEGWQVWETVSEGSPVSPVFPTAEELIDYLVENGDAWCQRRPDESPPSREATSRFVLGSGWVPSAAMINGKWKHGISIEEPDE